jgi:hypothetical protein
LWSKLCSRVGPWELWNALTDILWDASQDAVEFLQNGPNTDSVSVYGEFADGIFMRSGALLELLFGF